MPSACEDAVIVLPTVCNLHSTWCFQVWLIDRRRWSSDSAIFRMVRMSGWVELPKRLVYFFFPHSLAACPNLRRGTGVGPTMVRS
jgi:hypothetical protein